MIKNQCKVNTIYIIVINFLLLVFSSSCAPSKTFEMTPTIDSKNIVINTQTQIGETVVPTRSAYQTRITPPVLFTFTPIPTQTLPSIPKELSKSEKKTEVNRLLRDNGDCKTPCFFGIQPNTTTISEVQNSLFPIFGKGVLLKDQMGNISSYGSGFETSNHLRGEFVISFKSNVVKSIRFHLGNMYKPEVQSSDWSAFSLHNILLLYGIPSRVEFFIDNPHEPVSNPKVIVTYKLTFDQYDTEVFYFGTPMYEGQNYQLCLSDQKPEFMRLYIHEQEKEESTGILLENATSLTNETFYQLLMNNDDTCLNFKADVLTK